MTPLPVIGDRVKNRLDGDIGYVEKIWVPEGGDPDFWVDVRLLTPDNEPSCLITFGHLKNWYKVADDVLPFPMSEEWWEEARSFCAAIEDALKRADI